MVLPNSDSINIPWMVAEKNDWVPRKAAPFAWSKHEHPTDSAAKSDVPISQPNELKKKTEAGKGKFSWEPLFKNSARFAAQQERECTKSLRQTVSFNDMPSPESSSRSLQDLEVPLLGNDDLLTISQMQGVDTTDGPLPVRSLPDKDDYMNLKSPGRKTNRMRDLGKRMGEKIQEKSKNLVEKLRA